MRKLIILLPVILLLIGCTSITKSLKGKQNSITTECIGGKATAFDPATGTITPTGTFGWFKIMLQTIPMKKGQPYFAQYSTHSMWTGKLIGQTTVWVGKANVDSKLQITVTSGTVIKVSGDGIDCGDVTVEITEDKTNGKVRSEN